MGKKRNGNAQSPFWKVSDAVLNVSTVIALMTILGLMTLQIIMRYVFRNPLQWTDEISQMAMVWMTFLGSVVAFRERGHICVDLLTNIFPKGLSRIITGIIDVICIGFLCVLAVTGTQYVQANIKTVSLVTGLSKGLTYTVIPISAVWMILYVVRDMVANLKEGK